MSIRISHIWAAILAVCALNLLPISVFAQEGQVQDEQALSEATAESVDPITAAEQSMILGEGIIGATPVPAVSFWSIFRILLTLALVAMAIYGLVFILKRLSRGSIVRDPFLKVLASAPLGANRGMYVISVGSRAWLVGMAENAVNLISEIDDKDILNAMLLEDSRKIAKTPIVGRIPDFRSLLRKLGMPTEAGMPGPDSIRKHRERLKGM